jgi:hypothetical protein
VKIKKFSLDEDYGLSEDSYGSGVIISSSGLVLTNSHVVSSKSAFDNSNIETAYEVCLPDNTTDTPDCSYLGKLISQNEDLDVALLQIEKIPGLSDKSSFPYLELGSDNANVNDTVTAIGYPGVGEDSVTLTTGVVSGKIEKYNKKWIKTDAVISFGSSGGAALDQNNKVIGITSAGHSDLLGSLGYIINISSLNSWIENNRNLTPKVSALADRLKAFVKKERFINDSNVFTNSNPAFTVTKPDNWQFSYLSDGLLDIEDFGDNEGGFVVIQSKRFPYLVDLNNIVPRIKMRALEKGTLSFLNIQENKDVKISGLAAKKIRSSDLQDTVKSYILPFRDTLIYLNYDYGVDDKDKAIVDSLINSLVVKNTKAAFTEVKKYSNKTPKFSVSVDKDWAILVKNLKNNPIEIQSKKYKELSVKISLAKVPAEIKGLNNDKLMKLYKDQIDQLNQLMVNADTKLEWLESNAHYKVNNNFTDVIKSAAVLKRPSNGKPFAYKSTLSKKINDQYILDIVMVSTNPDKNAFNNYQKEFLKMMKNFSLK